MKTFRYSPELNPVSVLPGLFEEPIPIVVVIQGEKALDAWREATGRDITGFADFPDTTIEL